MITGGIFFLYANRPKKWKKKIERYEKSRQLRWE